MTWLPIVIYVPALAFNQGTNVYRAATDYIYISMKLIYLIYHTIIYLQLRGWMYT